MGIKSIPLVKEEKSIVKWIFQAPKVRRLKKRLPERYQRKINPLFKTYDLRELRFLEKKVEKK